MKKIFITLLGCLFLLGLPLQAQNAKSILDKTAAKLKSGAGIQVAFDATSFKGMQASGTTSGTMLLQGNRFKISSSALTTWFDGKTLWSLLSGSGEVNVSNPSPEELQQMNPYNFINLYKSGYKYSLQSTTYDGKPCYEVWLVAQSKGKPVEEMRLVIDKNYVPLSVRFKQKGEWMRIRVKSFVTGKNFDAATFRFNAKEHPGIEVIDLR